MDAMRKVVVGLGLSVDRSVLGASLQSGKPAERAGVREGICS
jgi:hypothetical protein